MSNLRHFKLTTGDDIICEVIEWPNEEDDTDIQMVVRNTYMIHSIESGVTGTRYYTFRPWMIYQDTPDCLQVINVNHIVGEATPAPLIVEHYVKALTSENENDETLKNRLEAYIEALREKISTQNVDDSSDLLNVIKFPDRNRLN